MVRFDLQTGVLQNVFLKKKKGIYTLLVRRYFDPVSRTSEVTYLCPGIIPLLSTIARSQTNRGSRSDQTELSRCKSHRSKPLLCIYFIISFLHTILEYQLDSQQQSSIYDYNLWHGAVKCIVSTYLGYIQSENLLIIFVQSLMARRVIKILCSPITKIVTLFLCWERGVGGEFQSNCIQGHLPQQGC